MDALTEYSPISGASLKKAEIFYGYLTFLAIPNEFWKGKGSLWSSFSQLSYKMGQIWSIKIRAQKWADMGTFKTVCNAAYNRGRPIIRSGLKFGAALISDFTVLIGDKSLLLWIKLIIKLPVCTLHFFSILSKIPPWMLI